MSGIWAFCCMIIVSSTFPAVFAWGGRRKEKSLPMSHTYGPVGMY